jgi:mono/diheme cytochrome c family protein
MLRARQYIQQWVVRWAVAALAVAVLVAPATAQQKPSGAKVWSSNCGRCHRVRAVDAYDARQWETVVTHMALSARLTADETQAVREFLVGSARARQNAQDAPAPAAADGPAGATVKQGLFLEPAARCCDPKVGGPIFKAQCAACHGQGGKGDGPAATALNPRPPDLRAAGRIAALPDDSLVQIITGGRRGMPAYGKTLTADQIQEVVAFMRTLKP